MGHQDDLPKADHKHLGQERKALLHTYKTAVINNLEMGKDYKKMEISQWSNKYK